MQIDFIDFLANHNDIKALLSQDSDGEPSISWITRPDGDGLPAITLEMISPELSYTQAGRSALMNNRVQIDIWSETYAAGRKIAKVLNSILTPADEFVSFDHGETHFSRFTLDADRDLPVADLGGGERVFHIAVDLIIWHKPKND